MKKMVMLVLVVLSAGWPGWAHTSGGAFVARLDRALDEIISADAKLETVRSDFGNAEGPKYNGCTGHDSRSERALVHGCQSLLCRRRLQNPLHYRSRACLPDSSEGPQFVILRILAAVRWPRDWSRGDRDRENDPLAAGHRPPSQTPVRRQRAPQ